MRAREAMSDRREHARFDVTGRLWASFGQDHEAILHNIAATGALIEATVAPPMLAMRVARLSLMSPGPELTVGIRYIRPVLDRAGDSRYLIGVEFVNLTESELAALEAFVDSCRQRHDR